MNSTSIPPPENGTRRKSYSKITRQRKKDLVTNLQEEAIALQLSIQSIQSKLTFGEIDFILSHLPDMDTNLRYLYPPNERNQITTEQLPTFQRLLQYIQTKYHHENILIVIQDLVKGDMKKHTQNLALELKKAGIDEPINLVGRKGMEGCRARMKEENEFEDDGDEEEDTHVMEGNDGEEEEEEEDDEEEEVGEAEEEEVDVPGSFKHPSPTADGTEGNPSKKQRLNPTDPSPVTTTASSNPSSSTATATTTTATTATLNAINAAKLAEQKNVEQLYLQMKVKNRLHARATRLRKKYFFERLKEIVHLLQQTKNLYESFLGIKSFAVAQTSLLAQHRHHQRQIN